MVIYFYSLLVEVEKTAWQDKDLNLPVVCGTLLTILYIQVICSMLSYLYMHTKGQN